MRVTVSKELNYVEEANGLLYNYINAVSYDKLKTEGRKRVAYSSELYDRRFEHIMNINDYVIPKLKADKSKLDFYFGEISNSPLICVSNYLLPLYNGINYKSLNEYEAVARQLTNQEILMNFDELITQSYSLGKSDEERTAETFEDLTRLMDRSNLTTEDKWKLVQIYLDRRKYLDELCQILSDVIGLLKECNIDVNAIEREFYDYWYDYTLKNDFMKEFQCFVNITWPNNQQGVIIIPSIFRPKSITISISDKEDKKEDKKEDIIHMGILLDSNFSNASKRIDSEDVNNALKLLSDKSKFEILKFIKNKPAYGFEIANELNLSTSTISYHMNALISANLVKLEKDMNKIYYSINSETLNEILEEIRSTLL
jgi:DNA-binding transcriptional ArsR family regulator